MKCCPKCFGDAFLATSVFPDFTTEIGTCSFCHSSPVLLVEPKRLFEIIQPLISIYERHSDGKTLVQWLKDDWDLFDHHEMDDARSKTLLAEILDDGQIVRVPFIPSPLYDTDSLTRWDELRDELMFGNRYFPSIQIDKDRLTASLSYISLNVRQLQIPAWYRARLLNQDADFTIDQMGPPPKKMASHGRANPAGIPYLYLASTPNTAISEVRPHTGEQACIATFNLSEDLHLVDLRNPRKLVSPLSIGNETQIGLRRSDVGLLARLGDELTRPVLPYSAAIDYVPSQYLCELIKTSGHAGVLYRSSVGDGVNLALFNPTHATGISVERRTVRRVSVDVA